MILLLPEPVFPARMMAAIGPFEDMFDPPALPDELERD